MLFRSGAFKDIFPLTNSDGSLVLEYVSYSFGEPKYSVEESIARDATYALPLKVKLRLMHKKEDGKEKELSEQEVYFGDVPLMTNTATFIINGAERVVVSQIHRSPGVIFEEDEEKRVSLKLKALLDRINKASYFVYLAHCLFITLITFYLQISGFTDITML